MFIVTLSEKIKAHRRGHVYFWVNIQERPLPRILASYCGRRTSSHWDNEFFESNTNILAVKEELRVVLGILIW